MLTSMLPRSVNLMELPTVGQNFAEYAVDIRHVEFSGRLEGDPTWFHGRWWLVGLTTSSSTSRNSKRIFFQRQFARF